MKDCTHRVEQVQSNIKCKEAEIRNKYAKIEKLNEQVVELSTKLQNIDNEQLNIKEKAKELENMIQVFIPVKFKVYTKKLICISNELK